MKAADYKMLGNIGISVGAALIILAIFVLFSGWRMDVSRDFWGNVTSISYVFPNLLYSIGLAVVGILFSAVGGALRVRGKEEIPTPPIYPP